MEPFTTTRCWPMAHCHWVFSKCAWKNGLRSKQD